MSESLKYILHTVWLQLEENLGLPEPCNFYQTKNILSYFFPYPLVKHRNLPFIFHFIIILFISLFAYSFFFFSLHHTFQVLNEITPYPQEKMKEMTVVESSSGYGSKNNAQNK